MVVDIIDLCREIMFTYKSDFIIMYLNLTLHEMVMHWF